MNTKTLFFALFLHFQKRILLINSVKCLFFCCAYMIVAEQKARTTYDNILRLVDDPAVKDPIKFLREREIVHFQRFGESLRRVQDKLDCKNFYAFNPAFDTKN